MSTHEHLGLIDLDELIRCAGELEPLPPSSARLAGIISQPEWEIEDLVDIINLDPALTGRLLRVANSAASAAQTKIRTVNDAVIRLGAGTVASLAVGGAVRGHMNQAIPEYGAVEGALWRHSVAAALGAECIRRVTRKPIPPESYTAALLHDIGKVTLAHHLGPDALLLIKRAQNEGELTQVLAEDELLEVNHGELGGLIAQHWKLPQSIVHAIIYHHDSGSAAFSEDAVLCDVVALADIVALEIGEGLGQPPPRRSTHEKIRERLGIDDRAFDDLCDLAIASFDETLAWYG